MESTKNKLFNVLSEYYIQRVEIGEVRPELEDQTPALREIQLFISAENLEGISSITLDDYLSGRISSAVGRIELKKCVQELCYG